MSQRRSRLMRQAVKRTGEALGRVIAEQRRLEERAAQAEHAARTWKARTKTRPGR